MLYYIGVIQLDKKQLGKNIKLIRQTKNITREDLAKKLNISYSSIEKYEQGLRGFRVEIIDKFAEALGVSVFELLDSNYDKAEYELEKGISNGCDNLLNLVSSFENSAKEESVKSFRKLIEVLDWKEFKDINDNDIYDVVNSQELYRYLSLLFFEKLNKKK